MDSIELSQRCRPGVATIRLAQESDRERWDSFVLKHPRGAPYHLFAWREALKNAYGLDTYYLLSENQSEAQLTGIFPAARVPKLFGRGPLCSLPYCDIGGPLAVNEATRLSLLDAIPKHEHPSHELRQSCPEELNTDANQSSTGDVENKPRSGTKARMLLALRTPSEDLFATFPSKLRSQIRKATKNGLVAKITPGPGQVEFFFEVYARNMRDLGSPAHSRLWFRAVAESYGEKCRIGVVLLDNKAVAAGVVLRCGDSAVIPWASTLREYNNLAPNMLLYWSLIADAADNGATQFDFGRSTIDEGTYRFKKQWGAQAVPLKWNTTASELCEASSHPNTLPFPAVTAGRNRKLVEACWQKLPVPLATALGAKIRPFISL